MYSTVKIDTKYGPLTVSAHGNTATATAGRNGDEFTINRIPYDFTVYFEWEHEDYRHQPIDNPRWIRTRSSGIYIHRQDVNYGLGEPTRNASSTIYNEVCDIVIEYLTSHPDFVKAGERDSLIRQIESWDKDLLRLGDEMNAIHDKIADAQVKLAEFEPVTA